MRRRASTREPGGPGFGRGGHESAATADESGVIAAFSPDESRALIQIAGRAAGMWDLRRTSGPKRIAGPEFMAAEQAFSRDGRRVLLAGSRVALVVDVPGGAVRGRLPGADEVLELVLSPHAEHVLALTKAGRPELRTGDRGALVRALPIDDAMEVSFDAQGRIEVVTEGSLVVWSADGGERLSTHPLPLRAVRAEASRALRGDDSRVALDEQALAVSDPTGKATTWSSRAVDGRRATWTNDGTWAGDESLLGFSHDLRTCPRRAPETATMSISSMRHADPP